jgi:hypothetical protein
MARFLASALLLLLMAAACFGEEAFSSLPSEAPSSLFDVTYGSADAQLLVKGSWQAGLTLSGGLALSQAGSASVSSTQPLLFTQTPDLFLSFLLFKRLFVEARVSSDITATKYSVGYRGAEGETLQELRLGNDGISFPVLPYLSLGGGSYRSFGLAARLGAPSFEGRAMLRYDQATRVEKRFVGGTEVTETAIKASDFIRGRYLVVPASSAAPVTSLALYAASASGKLSGSDGNTYRALEASEYSYSSLTGLISLTAAATTKVVASYGSVVASAGDKVTVSGKTCEVLYYGSDDATPTHLGAPTLYLSRYATSAAEGSDAFVRDLATGLPDSSYEVSVSSSGYAEVTWVKGGSSATDPQSSLARQPFASDIPGLYTTDFSSDAPSGGYAPAFSKSIVIRTYSSGSKISIATDVIEGSVEITRNGVPDYGFTVDAAGGAVTLATPPGLDEEIVVSYLRESSERSSGSLAGGLGGFFDLGEGRSAWTALGLRWSVPGTTYSSAGTSAPGNIVLTAGEKDEKGKFKQDAAIAARYATDVASGRYRLEGMEGASSYDTSYRVYSGTSSDYIVKEAADTSLASAFPTYMSSLHSDGSTQKALSIVSATSTPGGLLLARFVDEPPVSSLQTLSFFARKAAGTASAASLSVSLDEGGSGNADDELSVTIPAAAMSTGWTRYVLKYGSGDATVYAQDEEGGSLVAVASATGHVDLSKSASSRIAIEVSGLTAIGDAFYLDELLLEDSSGRASLLAKADMSYDDPGFALSLGGYDVVKGAKLSADASGALASSPYAGGGASVASSLGPFAVTARARASWADSSLSFRGGHDVAFPSFSFPLKVTDSFDVDPASGSFGRGDSLALALSVLSLSAKQASTWTPSGASALPGVMSQSWTASTAILGGVLSADLSASNRSATTSFPGLSGGYLEDWLAATTYALPAFEPYSTRRELSGSASLGLGAGKEVAIVSLSSIGLPSTLSPLRTDVTSLKLQIPLSFGDGLILTPYYKRALTEVQASAGTGLVDLGETAVNESLSRSTLWGEAPFAEFASSGFVSNFASEALASGASTITYVPEVGFGLARASSAAWPDLVLPTSIAASYKRTLKKEDSSYSSALALALNAKFEAVNAFGSFGFAPIFPFYESDEFTSSYDIDVSQTAGDSRPSLSYILQNSATLYANSNRDSLTFDNRFSWDDKPSTLAWSENLTASLSIVTKTSWLLDLYRLATRRLADDAQKRSDAKSKAAPQTEIAPDAKKPAIVSAYLEDLIASEAVSRTIIAAKARLGGTTTDADGSLYSLDATESVEFRVTVPQKLTLQARPSLTQIHVADTDKLTLGLSFYLGATISF